MHVDRGVTAILHEARSTDRPSLRRYLGTGRLLFLRRLTDENSGTRDGDLHSAVTGNADCQSQLLMPTTGTNNWCHRLVPANDARLGGPRSAGASAARVTQADKANRETGPCGAGLPVVIWNAGDVARRALIAPHRIAQDRGTIAGRRRMSVRTVTRQRPVHLGPVWLLPIPRPPVFWGHGREACYAPQ